MGEFRLYGYWKKRQIYRSLSASDCFGRDAIFVCNRLSFRFGLENNAKPSDLTPWPYTVAAACCSDRDLRPLSNVFRCVRVRTRSSFARRVFGFDGGRWTEVAWSIRHRCFARTPFRVYTESEVGTRRTPAILVRDVGSGPRGAGARFRGHAKRTPWKTARSNYSFFKTRAFVFGGGSRCSVPVSTYNQCSE